MSRSFSLDDLIALNDEIRALARAGVPLDRGLVALAKDLPRRLRHRVEQLGTSLEEGRSLDAALDDVGNVPPAYRAVVVAGLRSGQLAAALQGIAATSRRASEVSRVTAVAMLYPLLVLTVAAVVITFSMNNTSPLIHRIYEDFEIAQPAWYSFHFTVTQTLTPQLPWLWGFACLAAIGIWLASKPRLSIHGGGRGWIPGATKLAREGRLATFTDLLALLIEQRVPLNESIRLAAASTGDPGLSTAAEQLSKRIERGQTSAELPAGVPPLVGWLLVSGCSPDVLVRALRRAAINHQQRAAEYGRWLGVYVPMILSAGVGGGLALLYAMQVIGPFYYLMRAL